MTTPLRILLLTTASLLLATACLFATVGQAAEYRSVTEPSILYDTPSDQGKPLYIVSPGTPVEVIVVLDKWIKVRDAGGAITWIAGTALGSKRTVLVTAEHAVIRSRPEADAPPVFEAGRNLVLETNAQPVGGWIGVRHQDGSTGYIRVTEVWGL